MSKLAYISLMAANSMKNNPVVRQAFLYNFTDAYLESNVSNDFVCDVVGINLFLIILIAIY